MTTRLLSEKTSIILIVFGLIILFISVFPFIYRTSLLDFNHSINSEKFDHFGSFIGGLVGSIWTLSSIILFYLALIEQRKATNHQQIAIEDQKKAIEINVKALEAQVKSLEIQTREFELQRNELSQTREVFSEQSKTLKLQQFESTFFSMLNLHHQIVNSMEEIKIEERGNFDSELDIWIGLPEERKSKLISRNCFKYFFSEYKQFYNTISLKAKAQRNQDEELAVINESYTLFYIKYQPNLSHYFRYLYNILKFIDKKAPDDKFFHSNLLRAQLSSYELLLLFYNSISQFGKEKFKPLIEKYHFLQNMPKNPLLKKEIHLPFYEKSAFGNPNYTQEDI